MVVFCGEAKGAGKEIGSTTLGNGKIEFMTLGQPTLAREEGETVRGTIPLRCMAPKVTCGISLNYKGQGKKFAGLKRRLIEPRLRRVRLEQRKKKSGLRKWKLKGWERAPAELAHPGVPVEEEKKIEVEEQVDAGESGDNRYYLAVEIGGDIARSTTRARRVH